MNTETGRIYDLSELYPIDSKRGKEVEADVAAAKLELAEAMMRLPTTEVQFSDPAIELSVKEQRHELARAFAVDKAVYVSGEVAHTIRLGQKEKQRRSKRRQAQKKARKQNR